jgi:integrase/recombinase XerC
MQSELTADSLHVPATSDPIALLLADKRSPATKRAYRADLIDFFGGDPSTATVALFLGLGHTDVALRLATYKGELVGRGLANATINRRLAAIRSLLKVAHRIGQAATDGRGLVDGEKVRSYRDTRGVGLPTLRRILNGPDPNTLRGKRDLAILRVMVDLALRRAEVCALDVKDFHYSERKLMVTCKGRGTEKQAMTLSGKAADAIAEYLRAAGHESDLSASLFRNMDRRPGHKGGRLTTDGLYAIVERAGAVAGVTGLTPHKIRHSAITAALDATQGDVRKVQRLSRHADIRTLTIYDDNRSDMQGEVTGILAGLL